jgi:hypothetical protein
MLARHALKPTRESSRRGRWLCSDPTAGADTQPKAWTQSDLAYQHRSSLDTVDRTGVEDINLNSDSKGAFGVRAVGHWSFEKNPPRQMRRDPFEAEFFTGEDDDESDSSRTDSLVREALQNSLDATRGNAPVQVRIAIDRAVQVVDSTKVASYLGALVPHLDALGNGTVNNRSPAPKMDYLVIEDFGTHGLTGDPACARDPAVPSSAPPESFYWFWRNIGRSGKTGKNLGRWGLGKTVFPSASKINTFFGITRRSTDGRTLLMGQAITKLHVLNEVEYVPEGFYHDPKASGAIQMPYEDPEIIRAFLEDFRLTRGHEPGLSIVIPYPNGTFDSADLARSVILHFFTPILSGRLKVNVNGDGDRDFSIDRESIGEVANAIQWTGAARHKLHRPPPFELSKWAIQRQRNQDLEMLKVAGIERAPTWSEAIFAEGQLDRLREEFERGSRIAVRVPIQIERKLGGSVESHFDVFFQKESDQARAHDYFVREGMTISRISTLSGIRGVEALLMVDQGELSQLLGDAEGPTHTEWGTGEVRPDERYVKWKRRVTFVRSALSQLHALLSPPPAELQEDWIKDIFSIQSHGVSDATGPRGKRKKTPGSPHDLPPPKPRKFNITQELGGFRVEGTSDQTPPGRIRIRLAYDLPSGNPLSNWSRFDFSLDEDSSGSIQFSTSGARIVDRKENSFEVVVDDPVFRVDVTGFDPLRDLYCKAMLIEDQE